MTAALACCARLPADALPLLARWRDRSRLRVVRQVDELWVFWSADEEAVGRHLLAPAACRSGRPSRRNWYRPTDHLPLFDVPDPDSGVSWIAC